MDRKTIFAQATASGKAGVAIIRVSGPDVPELCSRIFDRSVQVRRPALRTLRDSQTGQILDECLVLRFAAGSSFTGEEVVEFHVHGSLSVTRSVLRALASEHGLRLAEPGEFTRRALENGRLDLTQVEGLSDLIEAETEAQRLQALRIMGGELSKKVGVWREKIIQALAYLEASIDFSEEELPPETVDEVVRTIEDLSREFEAELAGGEASERVRTGFEVAIVGEPNVGKSTLLNKIAGRDIAITSDQPGTTRDVLEVQLELGGQSVVLLDTAGQRTGLDEIEVIGIERARERAATADLRVFLCSEGWKPELGVALLPGDIIASAKSDINGNRIGLPVSGLTGSGIDVLLETIANELENRTSAASSLIRERHVASFRAAITCLANAQKQMRLGLGWEDLAAEELRLCVKAMDKVIGRVDVEGLLDVVFSSFCIGK